MAQVSVLHISIFSRCPFKPCILNPGPSFLHLRRLTFGCTLQLLKNASKEHPLLSTGKHPAISAASLESHFLTHTSGISMSSLKYMAFIIKMFEERYPTYTLYSDLFLIAIPGSLKHPQTLEV